eukprot:1529170-Lingulodinium_polyedra.AAC.1
MSDPVTDSGADPGAEARSWSAQLPCSSTAQGSQVSSRGVSVAKPTARAPPAALADSARAGPGAAPPAHVAGGAP